MNKRKKITIMIIVIVCEVLLVAGMLLFLLVKRDKAPESTAPETIAPTAEAEQPSETVFVPEGEMTEEPTQLPEETAAPETEAPTEAPAGQQKPSGSSKPGSSQNTQKPGTSTSKPEAPEVTKVTFPYSIPETDLVIEYLDSYSGVFMEDGSDKDISNITAMVLTNKGKTGVEYAKITLVSDNRELVFNLSALPAGATIVVQESTGAAYEKTEYSHCLCEIATLEKLEMSEKQVSVVENDKGALVVTNLTDETIPCIRIFYKFYMSDEDVYVAGITYTAKVTDLMGGGVSIVSPSHYAPGSSKVVMVRTYDSAE